jgi:hypothetical protein
MWIQPVKKVQVGCIHQVNVHKKSLKKLWHSGKAHPGEAAIARASSTARWRGCSRLLDITTQPGYPVTISQVMKRSEQVVEF